MEINLQQKGVKNMENLKAWNCTGPDDWADACTDDELSCEDGDSDHGYDLMG